MFLKNDWYMAAWGAEVGTEPLSRKIVNESIVLFRDAAGKVCALEDRCCHRGVALSLGKVLPEGLQCGYHGMVFDGGGQCVLIPGQDNIPRKACVRHFAVEEKDAIVWMWLGDPAEADRSKLVDYPWHNDAKWPHREGLLHFDCNYEMLIENIMDLTHLGYVHAKTIGGNPAAHASALMKTERTPRGVKFARWLLDSVPPPTYSRAVKFDGHIDRWQEEELITPCTIIQFTGGVDVSRGAYTGGSREGGFGMRVMHAIVPETETTCHYFYSVANNFQTDNPAVTELVFNQVTPTLLEDKAFCESQQAIALERHDAPFVDLKSDEARVLYRRHLTQRFEEQRQAELQKLQLRSEMAGAVTAG